MIRCMLYNYVVPLFGNRICLSNDIRDIVWIIIVMSYGVGK